MYVIPERLARVEQLTLLSGAHPDEQEQVEDMCVMEAVSYVAGEPWSDRPQCACPVIGSFLRSWNDGIRTDARRTELLRPLVARLVASKSTPEVELKRSYLALDWLVRVQLPAWLELAGLKNRAALIRELAELHDEASCRLATECVRAAQKEAYVAWDAARDAAWAAAGAAAGDAAWAAAGAAAGDAAWAAAGAAAWDAAWVTARDAAGGRLAPTVEQLQISALDLVERMLAV